MPEGLLGIENLSREQVQTILDRARDFQPREGAPRKLDLLRGRMIVNLFFEASTRTRTSFEIAAKRLGADTISITAQASSVSKGESLVDTLNTLAAMRPDAIVMRHAASGAPHFLQRHLERPIINAGDGTHEHPTQALLDARTILDRGASLEGLRVAIIGDIAAQPRGAIEHLSALEIRSRNRPVRPGVAFAAGAETDRARNHAHHRHARSHPRRRRHHDAARATGASATTRRSRQPNIIPSTACAWSTCNSRGRA